MSFFVSSPSYSVIESGAGVYRQHASGEPCLWGLSFFFFLLLFNTSSHRAAGVLLRMGGSNFSILLEIEGIG